ncbi:hypothetical protein Tco_1139360 [Tanacetum coccineum]
MDDAEKNDEDKAEEEKDTDQEPIQDEQAKDEVAGVLVSMTRKEKPKLLIFTSSQSVSSNYGNQFLISSPERSLLGTVKESTDAEITSMVDVQIQQEIPSVLSAPLLDVLASVVPQTPINPTPLPILTTSIMTTSEAPTSHFLKHAERQQKYQYIVKSSAKTALVEFDQKQALFNSTHESKSFNKHPTNKNLYHALMELLIAEENTVDQGVANLLKHKKRPHDDDDKDQDPPTGPDQGLMKRKTSKDAEPPKKTKSTGDDMGNTDEQPDVEAAPKADWFKKPQRAPTPDPEWNKGKSVDNEPA